MGHVRCGRLGAPPQEGTALARPGKDEKTPAPVTQFQLIGLAGVALAGVLAHVALTGRAPIVSRVVLGLTAATTAREAMQNVNPRL